MEEKIWIYRNIYGHTVRSEVEDGYDGSYTIRIESKDEDIFYLKVGTKYLKLLQTEDGFKKFKEVDKPPKDSEQESLVLSADEAVKLADIISEAGLAGDDDIFSREETNEEHERYRQWQEDKKQDGPFKREIDAFFKKRKDLAKDIWEQIKMFHNTPPNGFIALISLPKRQQEIAQRAIDEGRIKYPYCFIAFPPDFAHPEKLKKAFFIERAALDELTSVVGINSDGMSLLNEIKDRAHNQKIWFCIACGKNVEQAGHGHVKKCPECVDKRVVTFQKRFCNRCGTLYEKTPGQSGRSWASSTICPKCWLDNIIASGVFLKDRDDVLAIRETIHSDDPYLEAVIKGCLSIARFFFFPVIIPKDGGRYSHKFFVYEGDQEIGRFENEAQAIDFLKKPSV